MKMILEKQGKTASSLDDAVTLRSLGFRSLDFSELCLRAEIETGKELNFEATALRSIETVKDVCIFLDNATR